MQELAKLSLSCTLLFLGALIAAYAITAVVRMLRRVPQPLPNGQLRIRSGASVYRARFLGETREGWTFSAPLQRDAYVPLRVGEQLIVEAPSDRGLLRFRTTVIARRQEPAMMIAERPVEVHVEDRRSEARRTDLNHSGVRFEGGAAELVDISGCGARVRATRPVAQGERVRVDLPWCEEPCFAWTLDVEPSLGQFDARLRFEEPVSLPAQK